MTSVVARSEASAKPSAIPSHLRSFHRPSLTTEPNQNYLQSFHKSSPLSIVSSRSTVVPSHRNWNCNNPGKGSVRTTLQLVLLKDWKTAYKQAREHSKVQNKSRPQVSSSWTPQSQATRPQVPQSQAPQSQAPQPYASRTKIAAMRMKDSDDYLTARGANPWTGRISPSVSDANSPKTPTPATPGEALQLYQNGQLVGEIKPEAVRPPLRRANEGRKLSGETQHVDKSHGGTWWNYTAKTCASPRVACIKADAIVSNDDHAHVTDRFRIHMPSAHEPSPYEYPGWTTEQIQAHENRKLQGSLPSRSIPGGWQGAYDALEDASMQDHRKQTRGAYSEHRQRAHVNRVRPADRPSEQMRPVQDYSDATPQSLRATSFAPYASPETPFARTHDRTPMPMKHLPDHPGMQVRRKPVRFQLEHASHSPEPSEHLPLPKNSIAGAPDLSELPRVAFTHPAVVRRSQFQHSARHAREGHSHETRACSFGCHTTSGSTFCVERRVASNSGRLFDPLSSQLPVATPTRQLSKTSTVFNSAQSDPAPLDTLLTTILSLVTALCHIPFPSLPRPKTLQILQSDLSTPREKAAALKFMLLVTSQAATALMVVTILWQIGTAVGRVLEVLLWPFVGPLRVLRWVCEGA